MVVVGVVVVVLVPVAEVGDVPELILDEILRVARGAAVLLQQVRLARVELGILLSLAVGVTVSVIVDGTVVDHPYLLNLQMLCRYQFLGRTLTAGLQVAGSVDVTHVDLLML